MGGTVIIYRFSPEKQTWRCRQGALYWFVALRSGGMDNRPSTRRVYTNPRPDSGIPTV